MDASTAERTLHWQAIDRSRHIAREYRLTVSRDLFGWIVVERAWGRIGARKRMLREAFEHDEAAKRCVRSIVKQRNTAERRIGAAYTLVGEP